MSPGLNDLQQQRLAALHASIDVLASTGAGRLSARGLVTLARWISGGVAPSDEALGDLDVATLERLDRRAIGLASEQATFAVLDEVCEERARQHAKWGEQNHPNGTAPDAHLLRDTRFPTFDVLAVQATDRTDNHAAGGDLTYADVFLEEVFEAMAEHDPDRLRLELVQVAAVAVAWVEAIDRRINTPSTTATEHDDTTGA